MHTCSRRRDGVAVTQQEVHQAAEVRHGRTRPRLSATNGTQQTPQSSWVGPPQSPQRSRTLLRLGILPKATQPSSHMPTLTECLGHSLPGVAHIPGALASWRGTHAWGICLLTWNACLEHSLPGVEHMPGACASWRGNMSRPSLPGVDHMSGALAPWRGTHAWERMPGEFASWRGTHAWGTCFLAWNTCLGHSVAGVKRLPGAFASWRGTHAWGIRCLA